VQNLTHAGDKVVKLEVDVNEAVRAIEVAECLAIEVAENNADVNIMHDEVVSRVTKKGKGRALEDIEEKDANIVDDEVVSRVMNNGKRKAFEAIKEKDEITPCIHAIEVAEYLAIEVVETKVDVDILHDEVVSRVTNKGKGKALEAIEKKDGIAPCVRLIFCSCLFLEC
jgi:hypothetical protein